MNSGALISDSGEGEPQGGSRVAAESRSATGIRRLARMSSGVDAFGFQLTAAGRRRALMIAGSVAASLRALVKYASSWGPSTISDESSERRCRGGRSLRWSEALPWSAAEALRLHPTCPWQTAWNEGMRSAEGSARRGIRLSCAFTTLDDVARYPEPSLPPSPPRHVDNPHPCVSRTAVPVYNRKTNRKLNLASRKRTACAHACARFVGSRP